MFHRKKVTTVLIIGILGVLSNFLLEPAMKGMGICHESSFPELCFNLFYRGYVESVALFSAALVATSLLSLFVNRSVNRPWLIFTLVYSVIYIVVVLVTPSTSGFLQPQRDLVSLWLSVLYIVISILLIAYKSWQLKKQNTPTS